MAESISSVPHFMLASASPRRRELLEAAGYEFDVIPSSVIEPPPGDGVTAESYAVHLAWLKANDVARSAPCWVLGADTVTCIGGQILNKPEDRNDARRILGLLSGTQHDVITGICLCCRKLEASIVAHVTTVVTMRPLSEQALEEYLDTGLWEGKAGAYGIQDHDDAFVETVAGSYSNVMGLPMERLAELWRLAMKWSGAER